MFSREKAWRYASAAGGLWVVYTLQAVALPVYIDFEFNGSTPNYGGEYYNQIGSAEIGFDQVVPLLDTSASPSGLSFFYDRPAGSSYGFQNQPVYAFDTPSGRDLTHFDENLKVQLPGRVLEVSGLTPGQAYDISLLSWTYRSDFLTPMSFDVGGGGDWATWTPPGGAFLAINDELGLSSRSFDSYLRTITADSGGTFSLTSVAGQFTGIFGMVIEPQGPPATSGTLTLKPTVDGDYENDEGVETLDPVGGSLLAQRIDFIPLDRRFMMEFDLSTLPEGAVLTDAELTVDVGFFTSSPGETTDLDFYAYDGDGVIGFGDAFETDRFAGRTSAVVTTGEQVWSLDVAALNAAIEAGGDFLGLTALSGPDGNQVGLDSLEAEADFPSFAVAPRLKLDWELVAESLAGDYNGNGNVEQGDLDFVLNGWGALRGDWENADGFATASVDQEELDDVLNNWGASAAPLLSGFTVPEPAAGACVLIALCAGWRHRE